MDQIKDAILPEFEGDLPIAQINFFSVFKSCIQILENLCSHFNKDSEASAQLGFELVDGVLEEFSQHERNEKLAPLFPYLRSMRLAGLAFASLDHDKLLCEFAWDM
ncbi:hypothetical protein N7456_004415 [Penicillium angulare]|uniref:Uncharacterized protein n=1 Tax=Penicillium angulare TaxID=116970 RepID=A0A9W9FWH6_9EURO|nr:hypothetical protein N7456_004415 [Penicillium angulare]